MLNNTISHFVALVTGIFLLCAILNEQQSLRCMTHYFLLVLAVALLPYADRNAARCAFIKSVVSPAQAVHTIVMLRYVRIALHIVSYREHFIVFVRVY